MSLWDDKGEKDYTEFLHNQYENILLDFNKLFKDSSSKRVLEISSFLGVLDISLAKIDFEVHTYDIPEFQQNSKTPIIPFNIFLMDEALFVIESYQNHTNLYNAGRSFQNTMYN